MVPPRGNAPRSIGYQPIALLLSYGGMKVAPAPAEGALARATRAGSEVFWLRTRRAAFAPCGLACPWRESHSHLSLRRRPLLNLLSYRDNKSGAPGNATPAACRMRSANYLHALTRKAFAPRTPWWVRLFSKQYPRLNRTCSKMAPRRGLAPRRSA